MNGILLKGGRLVRTAKKEAELLDVAIGTNGRIARIGADLPCQGEDVIQLDGKLITPAFVDMHQHLDKSLSIDHAPNPSGTLAGAVAAFRDYAADLGKDEIAIHARRTMETCLEKGTVAIRSHANVDYELKLRSIEALAQLREDYKERMHLDVVAFVSSSAARGDLDTARTLLENALAAGADTIGGAPNLAPDPKAFIDMLLDVAVRHDRLLDLHIDETLSPDARCLEYLAERTQELALNGRVVAGHCSSLSAMDNSTAARIMDKVLEAGVGIVTLPAANLFLQARASAHLPARGLTRIVELLRLGVPVATASDNIQDAFVPVGTGDMLELARWTILAGHLLKDVPSTAFEMITATPAKLMHLESSGLEVGSWASLVVTSASSLADLVRSGATQRLVFYKGKVSSVPVAESWLGNARAVPALTSSYC